MKHQLVKLLRADNEVEIVGLGRKITEKIGIIGDKVK